MNGRLELNDEAGITVNKNFTARPVEAGSYDNFWGKGLLELP